MTKRRPERIEVIEFQEVVTFPDFADIEDGQLFALSLSNNTTTFTHGLHRFAAKYIPQIPGWALDNFGSRASVSSSIPSWGPGTTLVEGMT